MLEDAYQWIICVVFHWLRNERSRKLFFLTHGWESGYRCAEGLSSHVAYVRFQYLLCHPPLPDMPRPPTCEVLVECAKFRWNYSLAIVIVRQALWFGLPWLPVVWEADFVVRYRANCLSNICYNFCICPKFLNCTHKVTRASKWSVSIWVFAKFQLHCTERPPHLSLMWKVIIPWNRDNLKSLHNFVCYYCSALWKEKTISC